MQQFFRGKITSVEPSGKKYLDRIIIDIDTFMDKPVLDFGTLMSFSIEITHGASVGDTITMYYELERQ